MPCLEYTEFLESVGYLSSDLKVWAITSNSSFVPMSLFFQDSSYVFVRHFNHISLICGIWFPPSSLLAVPPVYCLLAHFESTNLVLCIQPALKLIKIFLNFKFVFCISRMFDSFLCTLILYYNPPFFHPFCLYLPQISLTC